MTEKSTQFPPIHRTIAVSWNQQAAFDRFTADFAKWWPKKTHSIGGPRVKRVVFEPRPGGVIFEEHLDGSRYLWGHVIEMDAPRRVAFTWHASYDESDAQHVEVTFTPEGAGTRVDLVSSGWEKMGDHARRAYRGYRVNWLAALQVYAEQRSRPLIMFKMIAFLIDVTGGREKFVRGSKGRMADAST